MATVRQPDDAQLAMLTDELCGDAVSNSAFATPGRLPLHLCLGWGLGAVTIGMMSNIFNLLVLRYATDYQIGRAHV